MPIYNVEIYLEAALKFVKKQTYKFFEVFLVDDGSTICHLIISTVGYPKNYAPLT